MRHVGNRFLFPDDATTLLAYTTADVYTFVDIPGRDLLRPEIENLRIGFRVRNLTNVVYAQWADSTYPDQVLLGAPRTYEVSASAKFQQAPADASALDRSFWLGADCLCQRGSGMPDNKIFRRRSPSIANTAPHRSQVND